MHEKVAIRTGESVALEFELAGLGSRFLALCVDLFIQAVVVVALVIAYFVFSVTIGQAGARLHLPAAIASSLPIAIMTIVIFILTIGYFIIFEMWWDGRSPGKRALGLRVIRDAGFPIDWGSSVIRNLVRIVEAALGFYALSTVSVLLSKENKRLGDIAAGTIVIRDSGYVAPDYATLAASLNTPVSDIQLPILDVILSLSKDGPGSSVARYAAIVAGAAIPIAGPCFDFDSPRESEAQHDTVDAIRMTR